MSTNDRRTFLSRLATLGAALGLSGSTAHASPPVLAQPGDEPWMKRLTGKQKVLFHSHMPTDGQAVRWGQTFLDTQKNTYGLADTDSTVVIGLNGRAIGWFFNDALWAKYPTIGEVMGAPGSKNPQAATLAGLAPRGAVLLACNNSIRASWQRFLSDTQKADQTLRNGFADEIKSNLLPGVEIVPAMVVTLQQAQDRGCRYIYAGG
jgi:intracellular sulfur oxidation DsrE/DsrF family protein